MTQLPEALEKRFQEIIAEWRSRSVYFNKQEKEQIRLHVFLEEWINENIGQPDECEFTMKHSIEGMYSLWIHASFPRQTIYFEDIGS